MTDNIIQPMPELAEEQLDSLRSDIAANGVLVPVVKDQHGRILDGHNRACIATELGMDYPTVNVTVEDDEDAWNKAVALNCSRRHLTREQVRTIVADEMRRRPGDSDRAIAKRIGCSPSTVGTVRAKLSNLDSLAAEFEETANEMRVQSCLRMIPLLFHPKLTTAQVQAAWQTGMADLDANKFLGPIAAVWLRHHVFQPLAEYLNDDWAADKERVRQHADDFKVYPDKELSQRLDGLTDWLPMMAVVLRESWPDVFADADTWVADRLLSNLDTEAVSW